MRIRLLLPLLVLLIGCPEAPGPAGKTPDAPVAERPPPDALDRPHDDPPATAPVGDNPKDPPPADPGPPIGQPEELQPVGDDGMAGDPDEEDPEPKVDDSWATPGEGSIRLFDGVRLYKDEERLEVKGRVRIKQGPTLELMGCTERGKTHESLLLFQCNPKQLHLALVMIGLKPSPQVGEFGEVKALDKGQKVVLEASWSVKDAPAEDTTAPAPVNGRITRRIEDLIYDQARKTSMPRVGWVFTGSRNVMVPKPPDWDKKHEVYAAEFAGNVAAVFHDPDALLDTPLIEGGDDTIYVAYSDRMPERGTKVILHLRKWKEGDGPKTDKPADDEPVDDKPGDDEPGDDKPADDKPADGDAPPK